jgi:type 1 fimbria pilin
VAVNQTLRNEGKLAKEFIMMNKKICVIALILLVLFATGTVFAESFQCNDPSDGSVNITFNGSTVYASYSGKSAQNFDVFVKLENGGTEILNFKFEKSKNDQTRIQQKPAKGPVKEVTNCSFKSY